MLENHWYVAAAGPRLRRKPRAARVLDRELVLNRREPTIVRQDREIMESAQPWYDRDGGAFERSVEADYAMLLARRIVELAGEGRWEEKRSSLPARRVLEIRA